MEGANHYQVLGVSFGATSDEIRAAYAGWLARLREGMGKTEHAGHAGPDLLDRLRAAYKTLSDPSTRSVYDATLGRGPVGAFPSAPAHTMTAPESATAQAGSLASPTPAGASDRHPFEFAGSGGEYFRIWIVNLLLSILTLGIYSAWAKVRREQYFHRNLILSGSGFDYHGQPLAILKGRALAFLMFVGVSIAQIIGPVPYLIAILALLSLVPWLVVRAFRFRAHNMSYRGLHFSFVGTYREALKVFIGYGLLSAFTLGLAFPLFLRAQKTFVLNNLHYGRAAFACDVGVWAFYRIFLAPVGAMVLLAAAIGFAIASAGNAGGGDAQAAAMVVVGVMMLVFFLMQLLIVPYLLVQVTNLIWNGTSIEQHRFGSSLGLWGYVGVVVSNWLLTVLTLGLYWPWAAVRMAAYRAAHMTLVTAGSLDDFVVGEATAAQALGDEAAEMFDMDVAL